MLFTCKGSSEYVDVVVYTTCGEVKFVPSRRRSVVSQNIHFRPITTVYDT